ncbi:MAG: ABC transporter ATP-binding protein [Lachnospiraceae bacterium]|nr:ABC transporter ATP-binding protein [Lachnospiraceae bacterium]
MKEKEEKKPSPISVLWGWGKQYHGKFISSVVFAVLGVACQMIPYFCVAHIVTMMVSGEQEFSRYVSACIVALCGYMGKVVFSNVSTVISHTAAYYTLRDLRKAITRKLARVPMGTILDTPSGQYKTTIVDRVEGMESTFAHLIPEMTANILVPLVIVVYLFILDWRMALLSLVTLVAGLAVMSAGMINYPVKWESAVKAGKEMANAIVEYIGGIEVVKAFSQSAGSYKKYSDAVNYNADYYVDRMRENQKTMSAYNAILPSVLICILPCGFAFCRSGSLELSTFLSIVIFSLGLVGPIIAAFTFTDDLAVLGTNVDEISQLLNAAELDHKDTPVKLANTNIGLDHVSFSYDRTTEALHDVNLSIRSGTMTALVGPSGSGKSTIAKLIAGYWDVTSGSITLGGHELKEIPLTEISDQISYVSQDNYLFNRSIRENIRMGRPGATDAEVEQAAKQSGCDAFIHKLDKGYDTIVGSAGSHLSGGERQRIAIARAMLKNAPVVILDEATAYIDPENEAVVQKAISVLTEGKTLIVIAHRLSTIINADNIVVVKDGTIHAQGTHDKLLETCPLYRDMWQAHIGAKDQM